MTDERQGEDLWAALARLPRGAGVVFRHYSLERQERRRLFDMVKRIARKRRLLILVAAPPRLARAWRAAGSHGLSGLPRREMIRSASAHNKLEIRAAERAGVRVIFLSPVFPTRSHPDVKTLGRTRFAWLARQSRLPIIALGGMDERRARTLAGAYGWAGIDAWS